MPLVVENMPRDGVYLYIISPLGRDNEPLRPIKIGITGSMASRLASIQTGSHVRLYATMEAMSMFCVAFKDYFTRNCARNGGQPTVEDLSEMINLPGWEAEIRSLRAWRQHYAENSNVQAIVVA
jgi:hypothetical protein